MEVRAPPTRLSATLHTSLCAPRLVPFPTPCMPPPPHSEPTLPFGNREGKIVRVVGQLRKFNQSRCLVAFHIRPLTDFNEYTFHFVEAIHTHLNHTKGPVSSPPTPRSLAAKPSLGYLASVSSPEHPTRQRFFPVQVPAGMPGAAPGAGMMGGMGGGMGGPPAGGIAAQPAAGANLQDTVLTFFNSYPDSETGMTVDACHQAMRASGVTLEQIKATVEHLVAEGHVYSTIDEQHYKGTM